MIKKLISILLVFSVNLFLLAHAILPHHHHNGVPHFSFIPMETHSHNHDSCCCEHDENDDDSCMFEQDVDVFFKSEDHSLRSVCCLEHSVQSGSLLTAILLSSLYDTSALLQDVPLTPPPYLITYSQCPVVSSTGLRAPPMARG